MPQFDPDAYLSQSKQAAFDPDAYLGKQPKTPSLMDSIKQGAIDLGAGAVRGAGSIGATLLYPIDKAQDLYYGDRNAGVTSLVTGKKPLSRNEERRQAMDDALSSMGADTNSLAFKGGKLAAEIAGTAGAGGAIARGAGALAPAIAQTPQGAAILNAVASGGMRTGVTPATVIGRVADIGTRSLGGAITGGASAGIVNPEDAVAGAATGAAFPLAVMGAGAAGRGIRNALTPTVTPEAAALYQRAAQLGIPVNAAQLSDSKFLKTLQSVLENTPLTGAEGAKQNQLNAFTRAVSNTFGEDTPSITREVYNRARTRIGGEFNRLSANNNMQGDLGMIGRLGQIQDEAQRFSTTDTSRIVNNALDELLSKADANGVIPGRAYQSFDSLMARQLRNAGPEAPYLGRLREAVQNTMDASIAPADRQAWATARGQYRNLKTIRDLVAKEGSDGTISPSGLMGRVNASQAGKEAMARGTSGDLGELAIIGKQFVRDPIPNSGTAQRMSINALLGGLGGGGALVSLPATLGVAGGTVAAGRMANQALNSNALAQAMLNRGQQIAPQDVNALIQFMQRSAPVVVPQVSQ